MLNRKSQGLDLQESRLADQAIEIDTQGMFKIEDDTIHSDQQMQFVTEDGLFFRGGSSIGRAVRFPVTAGGSKGYQTKLDHR